MNNLKIAVAIAVLGSASMAVSANAADWSGPYIGGYYSADSGEDYYPDNFDTQYYALVGDSYGIFAGYNMDQGNYVFGLEVATAIGIDLIEETDPDWIFGSMTDLKFRVGYKSGNALPYVLVGGSMAEFGDIPDGDVDTLTGLVAGAGVDYMFSGGFFVGAEYLYRDMYKDNFAGEGYEVFSQVSSFQVRAGMKF